MDNATDEITYSALVNAVIVNTGGADQIRTGRRHETRWTGRAAM